MRSIVIGLIFAAVILAGGTAYMLRSYLLSQEAEFASRSVKAPTTEVMVAAVDMPLGTVINQKNVEWLEWPEDAVRDEFLVRQGDKNPLRDLVKTKHVARHAFTKGEPITMAKLYQSEDPGFLSGALTPGMRAVAVKINAETSAGGFVLPGDHVDVVLTHSLIRRAMDQMVPEDPDKNIKAMEHASETIVEDLRVLAVDQKVNEFETGAMVAQTILLEVTPKQAEILYTAKSMGKISLVLRSAEMGEPHTTTQFTTDIEVSPILRAYDRLVHGDDTMGSDTSSGNFINDTNSLMSDPQPMSRPQTQASPSQTKAPSLSKPSSSASTRSTPAPQPKRKISVYRGPGESNAGGNGTDGANQMLQDTGAAQ